MTDTDIADAISDALFEAAAVWDARLREPGCDDAVKAGFQDWLASDSRHPRAYAEARALWDALREPAQSLAQGPVGTRSVTPSIARPRPAARIVVPDAWMKAPAPSSPRWMRQRSSRRMMVQTGSLAAACLAVVVGLWGWQGGFDDLRSDYVTATGEHRSVVLADRSHIDLNTDTALAADLGSDARTAHLYRGEAYFDIAADPSRPFTVLTPAGEVRVLGTAFNIRLAENDKGEDGMIVSVTRGHVAVTPGGAQAGTHADLLPGQQLAVDGGKLGQIGGFDAFSLAAWQKGQIVFYRTALGTVVEELNRYRRGPIVITNAAIRQLPVSGVFDLRRPDAILETLRATLGLQVTNIADLLVLMS
jgi:transmembrane sensor